MRTSAGLSRVQAPPLLGSVLFFRGCWGVCECAKPRGSGRGASGAAGARLPHAAGSCSPGPGGAWEAGGGSGFLGADSAGRARGLTLESWELQGAARRDAARGARAAAVRRRPRSAARAPGRFRSGTDLLKSFNHD